MAIAKTRSLVILLILFSIGLVYTLPARLVIPILTPESAGVYLRGIDGFWHKGSAKSANVLTNGMTVNLNSLNWDVSLLSLLLGRLAADIEAEFSGKPIELTLSRSAAGKLTVDNLFADINFDDIRPILRQLIVPIDGRLILLDAELDYDAGWFEHIGGTAELKNLVATVPLGPLSLGDITFSLAKSESDTDPETSSAVEANIIQYDGPYDLDGTVLLQPNWALAANLTSVPNDTVSPMIVQQMGFIFGPPTNGQFTFNYSDE